LNEEKEAKLHQRNFSIFTASKSTCSSSGDSYLGGVLENKLNKSKNLLQKNLFETQNNQNIAYHHKNSLSMNTPNNKKFLKPCPKTYDKRENIEAAFIVNHNKQLFSYKAMKNSRISNKSLNNFDENFLKSKKNQKINENVHSRTKTSIFQSYFQSYLGPKEIRKESPDQSFFLNVNELSYTEIQPQKKIENLNAFSIQYEKNKSINRNLAKFINLPIDNSKNQQEPQQGDYQTPQSKKRLYTVEEVFSISNDSSSLNDTNCFKFSNTNSAKKQNLNLNIKINKGEKLRNVLNFIFLWLFLMFFYDKRLQMLSKKMKKSA